MSFSFHFVFSIFVKETEHFVPNVVWNPIRMLTTSVGVKLGIRHFFIEKFTLFDGMSFIFDVVGEKSWNFEFVESLNVAADRPIHNQKFTDIWVFVDCIEDCCSSLGSPVHGKEVFVVKELKDLSENEQGIVSDRLFFTFGLAVSRTVNGDHVKLLDKGHPNKVLMKKPSKILAGVAWA